MVKNATKAEPKRQRQRKPKPETAKSPPPLPSEKVVAQREYHRERVMARPERPESVVEVTKDRTTITAAEGQDDKFYSAAILDAFGTSSIPFLNELSDMIYRVQAANAKTATQRYNFTAAVMGAIAPENELEALLAGQIICANDGAMRAMRAMTTADYLPQHQMYGNLANKFMRSSAVLVDALAKLRRGGEQVVRHIHVNEGGQAVFAQTINNGGRGNVEVVEQSHAAGAIGASAAMLSQDAAGNGVPVPRDAERALSHARRDESGGAEGQ